MFSKQALVLHSTYCRSWLGMPPKFANGHMHPPTPSSTAPAAAAPLFPQEGQLKVEREKVTIETPELDPSLIFEQDPVQILDALLPLYMNSCLLRSLQEALASELAARMNAMNSATDNAKELKKVRGMLCSNCINLCLP